MNTGEKLHARDLAQRLAEAEATIAALLSGQIDAVVDSTSKTPVLLANAQDALRASEERLRRERDRAQQYLDAADVILLALDLDGRITLVNRYACSVLGWTEEELLGRNWIETSLPSRMQDALRMTFHSLLDGDLSIIENHILTRSGEERLIEWRNRLLRDDEGRVIGTLSSGTDITERNRAADAIRTAEERIRFALEAAGVGIWDMDCTTEVVRWSEILESQYGLQPGTFGGTFQAFIERIQAEDRESVLEAVGKAMMSGSDFSILNRSIWSDGTVRWLSGAGRFLLGEAGEPVRGVGISQDVTERRHAEAALLTSTAALVERTKILEEQAAVLSEQAALLDLAPDAIVVRDMQNRIVFWNRGAEVLYGWLSKEALGRDTRELLKADFCEAIEAEFLRQGRWEGEAIHYTRDGTQLIVASRWTMQRNAGGAPVRILTISNDITGRKQADAERLLLTERLSLATAVARVGVWDWDLASRTLTWDATMFEIYGFPPVIPMPYGQWSAAVHPEDLPARDAALQRAIAEKGQGSAEFRIILKDGSVKNISEVEKVVLDERGNVSRVVGVNEDVTRRKEAEAELRNAKDAAEDANQAKSEFLANMSHEIRTPMNGVIGMTDLVLDTELTAEQRENLGIVKSCADALLTIINDILDFSRIEARKLELDPIDFSVHDVIGDTAKALALRAQQKGLELIVDVGPAVPQTLIGDPGRLRQILVNLLGNAIKFTNHGEVVLRVTKETGTERHDVVLHFSVRDTGIGIPLDRQKRVFEAFRQGDGSTTRMYGGAGLGLTISLQLVQLMGGCLWFESEAGRGSTFHFNAHFAPKKPSVTTAMVPDSVDLPDLPVLVVDDNVTNRHLLERRLIGLGTVPTLAASVPESLAALRVAPESGAFPLVPTDSRMPDADGFILAETIKKVPATADPPIVVPARVTRHFLREARQTGRILLVEDDWVNQLVAKHLLEKQGHTVIVANNGREALAILEDKASVGFDCVLMDVQMPEMGGFECTAIIREREQTTGSHLPIIAVTAHAMKGDDSRCLAAGMDAYLSKPLEPNSFLDVIESQLCISSASRPTFPLRKG
jgi:two-component system sensor histidine kinase/response regulator